MVSGSVELFFWEGKFSDDAINDVWVQFWAFLVTGNRIKVAFTVEEDSMAPFPPRFRGMNVVLL